MILHIVNKSSSETNAFKTAINTATPGDTILLIEAGVYCASKHLIKRFEHSLIEKQINLFALDEDTKARGLDQLSSSAKLTNYAGFVDLVTQHDSSVSWT